MRGSIFTENIPAPRANSTSMFEKKKGQVAIIHRTIYPNFPLLRKQREFMFLNNASSVFSKARHVSRHENTMTPFFPFRESHVLLIPMARGGNE